MENPTGKLSLVFRRKASGKSYLAKQYYKLPLQIMPPHYQDKDGTVFAYMLNPSGGILQHDRLLTEITMDEGSRALVTTPASTKIYKMDDGFAVLENKIEMRGGSILEYLPESNVPFAGSKTYQNTEFHLDKGATLISFDMVTPGRVSRGEVFQYDIYEAKTKIYVDGKLIAYDSARIEPEKMDLTAPGMIECRGANGTIYIYRDKMGGETIDAVRAFGRTAQPKDGAKFEAEREGDAGYVKFGATMVMDSLMVVRLISEHTWALENTMLRIWDIIRRSLLGKPAVRIRKY